MRRLHIMMIGDVDESGERAALARGEFGIGSDASHMSRVAQRQHAGPVFLGLHDRPAHRVSGHALAIAPARVHHQKRPGVEHRFRRLVGHEQSIAQKTDISGQHANAMRIMAREIGTDKMIGDFGGFTLITAHAASDQMCDGAQRARLKGQHQPRLTREKAIGQQGMLMTAALSLERDRAAVNQNAR